MKKFMDDNFLLENEVSKKLYHEYAKNMPIFDYHCHLNPQEIAENKKFENLTQLWLYGDHYKWRAMRSNGIDEKYITGDASDYEKFYKFVETIEYCFGNPLYHWSHLELKRYFGIEEVINRKNAEIIWKKANECLKQDEFSTKNLIKNSNVVAVCTTDDPVDSLEYHLAISNDKEFEVKVLPTFRPDKAMQVENTDEYLAWLDKLSEVTGLTINSFETLVTGLKARVKFFVENGCLVTDLSMEEPFFKMATPEELETLFSKVLKREKLTSDEVEAYKTALFVELGKEYKKYDLGMQLHMGAQRNNNTRMFEKLGRDIGMDSIGDYSYAYKLSKLLNELEREEKLPKTILYCLNPKDNEVLGTMIGNFQGKDIPGKMQFGSGWWFLDQKNGMLNQMTTLANLGLLRRFVGMLTDSRSFISYTRHEYFRRIMCNLVGTWVENGEVPYDEEILKPMIQEICYLNAKNYFKLEV